MKIAILSDIHSNLEALQTVVADIESREPDQVVCLGDIVGYGPDPEETVTLFRQKEYQSVLGNHEAALKEKKMRNWLNFQAKENSIKTEELLTHDNLCFCRELDRSAVIQGALFVHGFPPDSLIRYVTLAEDSDIQQWFDTGNQKISFVGHTHDLLAISWNGRTLKRQKLTRDTVALHPDTHYIINAGSVGQPRDGNNNAKYMLWDCEANTLEVIFLEYDIEKTTRKIRDRGFPEAYGLRLW